MTVTPAQPPFLYVDSDVPEGMTLVEWRRRRHRPRPHRSRLLAAIRQDARRARR
jgi:hypothetical protein